MVVVVVVVVVILFVYVLVGLCRPLRMLHLLGLGGIDWLRWAAAMLIMSDSNQHIGLVFICFYPTSYGMHSIDVAYCYRRVSWSVCRSVTRMYPAKMAGLIEMLFGMWALVGHSYHVLDGGPDSHPGKGACSGMPAVVYSTTQCGVLSNYFDLLLYL